MPIKQLQLREGEKKLLVLHRHWFVLAREFAAIVFMLAIGVVAFSLRDSLYVFVDASIAGPIAAFLLSLYTLLVLALAFAMWINYRLDVWIITSRRIIDVEQRGLFNREVSEFLISRVQDITAETPNIITTLLNFGNLTIQTAGHQNFTIREVPKLEEAKRIILEYSHKARGKELGISL